MQVRYAYELQLIPFEVFEELQRAEDEARDSDPDCGCSDWGACEGHRAEHWADR